LASAALNTAGPLLRGKTTQAELATLIARDTERWGRAVREARITLE
jgi:hypothetical protein